MIEGSCDPAFTAVRRAFEANFRDHGEVGAAVHVTVHGEPVVDLWGGWADPGERVPWTADFDRMCAAVAATEPWWTPGERHAYHTNTYGHLMGGSLHHVTGELPGTLLARVARPLDADVHWGLADADLARCAEVVWDAPAVPRPPAHRGARAEAGQVSADRDAEMVLLGYVNPSGCSSMGVVNSTEWRRAQVPSTNGHMSARGIARQYGAVVDGRLLDTDLQAEAVCPQSTGPCPVLQQDVAFGLGLQPWTPKRPFGRTSAGFGHYVTGAPRLRRSVARPDVRVRHESRDPA